MAVAAALVGSVLLVVSAFLVWGSLDIKIGTISEKGTDSAAGITVIALGAAVAALLVAWRAGLPLRFVRVGWALLGLAAIGLSIYAIVQIKGAPADFFSNVTGAVKDSGLSSVLGEIGIDQGTVSNIASKIASVDYGPGVFVAMAGGVATLLAALSAR